MNPTNQLWANNRLRLIVTGDCNIDCFYCHNEGQPKTLMRISESLIARVCELLSYGSSMLDSISISGGEPLLHPNLEKIVSRVSRFANTRTLVTNGLLLSGEKLSKLKDAGLTKVRLGVDSITQSRTRPSRNIFPPTSIYKIINTIFESQLKFELNIVLTRFNESEIVDLLIFCKEHKTSAKFFEHVRVFSFGDQFKHGSIIPYPLVPFETFVDAVKSVFPNAFPAVSPIMGDANTVFDCGGVNISYCRYLCPFRLCYMTGTRIDPSGYVYSCMAGDGKYRIDLSKDLHHSVNLIESSIRDGCSLASKNEYIK